MEQHYKLLTPGPLTTSDSVKSSMLKDWCTWDDDYNEDIVQRVRHQLVTLATDSKDYTCVLMQGSGTASVEAAIGTFVSQSEKLLIITNGAYGARIKTICEYLGIAHDVIKYDETTIPSEEDVKRRLDEDTSISHIAMVHCETTTGILNPVSEIASLAKDQGKAFILDAMSSFGGIPMDIDTLGVDVLISSANKCIQGVPGFGFVLARQALLEKTRGQSPSLSLDLFDQWQTMQKGNGKWRFTSPTHVVRAFYQALFELEQEGGINARYRRYSESQKLLVNGMRNLGFRTLLDDSVHSPIITSFYSPKSELFQFKKFYGLLKDKGFVIYPGKISQADCFRIGNIGEIYQEDIQKLLEAVEESIYW